MGLPICRVFAVCCPCALCVFPVCLLCLLASPDPACIAAIAPGAEAAALGRRHPQCERTPQPVRSGAIRCPWRGSPRSDGGAGQGSRWSRPAGQASGRRQHQPRAAGRTNTGRRYGWRSAHASGWRPGFVIGIPWTIPPQTPTFLMHRGQRASAPRPLPTKEGPVYGTDSHLGRAYSGLPMHLKPPQGGFRVLRPRQAISGRPPAT